MAKRAPSKVPSSAEKDGIVWTRKQREKVFGSARPLSIDVVPPTLEAAWAGICELYGKPELYPLPKEADRKVEKVLAELRAEMQGGACPSTTTLERERLRAHLLEHEGMLPCPQRKATGHTAAAMVPFWAGLEGLAFAVRMVWTPCVQGMGGASCGEARRTWGERTKGPLGELRNDAWWLNLRRQALAAPAGEYDEAVRVCEEMRARVKRDAASDRSWGAHTVMTHEVDFAATFCRCPDEAHRLAETILGSPHMDSLALLCAIQDASLAMAFAKAHAEHGNSAETLAFHLVDNLGRNAAPALLLFLESVTFDKDARKALASAAFLADPDLCRASVAKLHGAAKTALGAVL